MGHPRNDYFGPIRRAINGLARGLVIWTGRAMPMLIPIGALALVMVLEFEAVTHWSTFAGYRVPPAGIAVLLGILTVTGAVAGASFWLYRVEHRSLLRAQERIQYKDAIVIGTAFVIVVAVGFILVSATSAEFLASARKKRDAAPMLTDWRAYLPLIWAFAGTALGGAVGFLFGLPKPPSNGTTNTQFPSNYIHTGLDDIVDWLTKGVTTVALVKAEAVLRHFPEWADELAKGLSQGNPNPAAEARAFAEGILLFFPTVGLVGIYLVTRTYLTGALTRADRTTLGAFSSVGLRYADVLLLQRSLRAMDETERKISPEASSVARTLANLSLDDLELPIEFALWAKAKSAQGEHEEALRGFEKAIALCPNDPETLLEYSVTLQAHGNDDRAMDTIEQAYRSISASTDPRVVKQIYKSISFAYLYLSPPIGFQNTIRILSEYASRPTALESGGIQVNLACAHGQRYRYFALKAGWKPGDHPWTKPTAITPEMEVSREEALKAVRNAIAINPRWIDLLRRQFLYYYKDKDGKPKDKEENDLEVFEWDEEFRAMLAPAAETASLKPT